MQTKTCQNCKNTFVIEPDDFSFYEKVKVPPPTFCPKCRRIRRLSWRNDFYLYNRNCSTCKKPFISIYAPDSGFTVLCPKCFHSDIWDPYEYAREYDPSKSFIEQIIALYRDTPVLGIVNDNDIGSINCLYTNDVAFAKNCAMTFIAWRVENVFNSVSLAAGKDLSDCLGIAEESSFTYEAVMSNGVSYCKNVYWCTECIQCTLCYDLRGCQDCFMSSGLRNKRYYFKNQQYSKEEYHNILNSYKLSTRDGYNKAKKEFDDFLKAKPRKFAELQNCVNCTGSDIVRGKNTKASAFASFSEDSKFVHNGVTFKACYDCEVGGETELAYECITPDHSFMSLSTIECWKNNTIAYSFDCHSSNNILGCSGIKKGEYVILNKKYSKEEYEKLYSQIVLDMKEMGEWGEFFPSKFSPFGVNETRAKDQLGITKDNASLLGFKWQDAIQETRGKETVSQSDVPQDIVEVGESFINEILACEECGRNYKILQDELLLYKRLSVPIPEKCFFCRHNKRQSYRGGYDLMKRSCSCSEKDHSHNGRCGESFETFFTEKEPRPVYCEACYQKILI